LIRTRRHRIALTIVALLVAGCGAPTPTPQPTTAGQPSPPPSVPPGPSGSASSSLPGGSLAASISPTGVAADPTLLDLVPAAAAGATLTYDPATTASVATDPSLARDVSYLATGLARPANAAPDDPNIAIVNAVRVRDPGSASDAWFRDWRDTYDKAACAQAGGLARNAQFDVDGLVVFVGACANGAFTYHVRIGDGAIVLSITSIGPADLGRQIVQRLHR
jgi:hypothetical protein